MDGPEGAVVRKRSYADTDIEAAVRDENCADSASSLDGLGRPTKGSDSNGSSPRLRANETGFDDMDERSCRWPACRLSFRASLAVLALVATLAPFLIPSSVQRIGAIKKNMAVSFASRAKSYAEMAKAHGGAPASIPRHTQRHCRPPPKANDTERLHVAGLEGHPVMEQPQDRVQWLVPARSDGLLSMLTPVFPDDENLALLRNQLRTANKFLNMDTVKEWVFVAPEDLVPTLVHWLEEQLVDLPCILASKVRVVADEACAPELLPSKLEGIAGIHALGISNWIKQQVVKLACGFTIQTPYHLITDADTFFMRNLEALDLMNQKECTETSSVCDLQRKVQFTALNELQKPIEYEDQQDWITSTALVLNITRPEQPAMTMGVTPQIMSRAVLDRLVQHIEQNVSAAGENWRVYLLRKQAERLANEDKRTLPSWTEYDLYWLYATHAGLWDKYHMHAELQREQANLWVEKQFKDWNPCDEKDLEIHNGFWGVVQSRLHISAAHIWKKLAPCMKHAEKALAPGVEAV